jgi:predicted nuclease with TOPRIM domain
MSAESDLNSMREVIAELYKENMRLKQSLDARKQAFRNLQQRKSKAHKDVRKKYEALVGSVLAHAREGRDSRLSEWARNALGEDAK